MKIKVGFHIFRSDLSLYDNTALIELANNVDFIYCLFIYTPEQVSNSKYQNPSSYQFLHESILDLDKQLSIYNIKLYQFIGNQETIIDNIIKHFSKQTDIELVFSFNNDYSEYAIKRDMSIIEKCKKYNVEVIYKKHKTLIDIEKTRRVDKGYFKRFTPFYNVALKYDVVKPKGITIKLKKILKKTQITFVNKIFTSLQNKLKTTDSSYLSKFYTYKELRQKGGRSESIRILNNLDRFKTYGDTRDTLIIPTSGLSAHFKFGTITPREVYDYAVKKLGKQSEFIRQLYWRDFYYTVALNFKEQYPQTSIYDWQRNTQIITMKPKKEAELLKSWQEGKTGYPVIDAAMRELNETGFMHNRMRMATASFLSKTMLVNWRLGEDYFARKLVDYDFCMNFGNWTWVVGQMSHSQPPFRILSPWAQSKKADKNGEYIKKWVPELKEVNSEHLHKWDECYHLYPNIDYPKQKVDYSEQRKKWMDNYKKLL